MSAFLFMNAADQKLQALQVSYYIKAGSFPISQYIVGLLPEASSSLVAIERFSWWFHIVGVLAFLNYLPISKHLHILLAFPNTYFTRLEPKGKFSNMESVTAEVKAVNVERIPTVFVGDEAFVETIDLENFKNAVEKHFL